MTVHFTLKRKGWGYEDIYEALKTGEKTSEWRDTTDFWARRLFTPLGVLWYDRIKRIGLPEGNVAISPEVFIKHKTARFVVGYTKYPRLIADITQIKYHVDNHQFEVQIKNVREELGS